MGTILISKVNVRLVDKGEIILSFYEKSIDKDVPIPLYYQLKTIIQDMIESGELQPGDLIPTEKEFEEIYHISRTTIRQAITELVSSGLLYRIKSKGTFVAKPRIEIRNMQNLDVRHEFIRDQNVVPTNKLIAMKKISASLEIAQKLGLAEGTEIVRVELIRLADKIPLFYQDSYLTKPCFEILDIDVEKRGINSFLYSREETRPMSATRWIEAILADKKISERLELPRFSAVQLVKTVSRNKDGKPVEYNISYFRGDRSTCVMEIKW